MCPQGDYGGGRDSGSTMMKPPIILARQEKRSNDPPTMLPSPGAVSIMQRESSGSHLPSSPPMPAGAFPSAHSGGGDPLLPTSSMGGGHPQQAIPQVLKARGGGDEGKARSPRRQENMSSGPSNYTPLQPSGGGGRGGGRGGDMMGAGGHVRGDSNHSVFLSQGSEMTHSIKLVDKHMHWDDKAMDVSGREGGREKILIMRATDKLFEFLLGIFSFSVHVGAE